MSLVVMLEILGLLEASARCRATHLMVPTNVLDDVDHSGKTP